MAARPQSLQGLVRMVKKVRDTSSGLLLVQCMEGERAFGSDLILGQWLLGSLVTRRPGKRSEEGPFRVETESEGPCLAEICQVEDTHFPGSPQQTK